MLVPITPQSYAASRSRRRVLPVVLVVLLLVLLGGGGVMVLTSGGHGNPTPVSLQRRSAWIGALAAHPTPVAAHPVPPKNDIERLALAAAREFGITDTLALAVMQQESGGDPRAVSPVGARGLLQVMPATGAGIAEELGVAGYTPAMLDDPAVNVRFGMYYLHTQIGRFGLAWGLAAYNWGPGGVGDFLATYPAARAMEWDAVRQQYGGVIPGETQHYVTNILAIRAQLDQTYAAVPARVTGTSAVVAATATGTGTVMFPIHSTQGALTLTVVSVVRATGTLTVAIRLDNAGPALAVAPTMLHVTSASGQAYMLPATWGTHTIPEQGDLAVQLVCAPAPSATDTLFVAVWVAPAPPIAIAVPLAP